MENTTIKHQDSNRDKPIISFFKQISQKKDTLFFSVLTLIALSASLFVWYCTSKSFSTWGFSDSAVYFSAAQNFALGRGVGIVYPNGSFARLTIFAPFYSIVLGVFVFLGIDPFLAARIIDIAAFGLFVFLMGFLFYRLSDSPILSLAIAILCFGNHRMVISYTSLLSEPLAFTLGFAGFLATILYAVKKQKRVLYISGLLCGLALFTRYAFVVFPLAGILILFFFVKDNIKTRVLSVLQYGILGFGPIGLWLSSEIFQNHTVGSRQIVIDGSFIEKLTVVGKKIIEVTKYWLPYRTHMIHGVKAEVLSPILLAFFISIVVLGFLSYFLLTRKTKNMNQAPFILTFSLLMLFIFYLLFVVSANIFTGMASIQDRILSPILPMTFGILLSSLWMIGQYTKVKAPVIWICSLIIVFFFVKYDYSLILRSTVDYEDVSPAWVDRPIFEVIRKMNIEKTDLVFSNGPDIVLYYSNVYPYYLTKTMASTGGVELSLGGESTLGRCQIYLLFPPDFIDRIQRQEDRIDDETILNLQTAFQTYYAGSDGSILYNDSCGSDFQ